MEGSKNYTLLKEDKDEGVIKMENSNYGGHYVISSENLKGEYYVEVERQSQTAEK